MADQVTKVEAIETAESPDASKSVKWIPSRQIEIPPADRDRIVRVLLEDTLQRKAD